MPQGGNTGLAGGATPDDSGTQAVLSLARLNRVRELDAHNNTITVEAGVILAEVQARAQEAGRLFALSLAAEGSCTIGGNLSTNAGGTAVLRYGNTRELCLGLEVVTPQGEIWHGLRGLRKDNTGYDLRDLYIGAEGTLGIITAAVMKLHPRPAAQVTALAALEIAACRARLPGTGPALRRPAADRLRADVRFLHAPGRQALSAVALPVLDHPCTDGPARAVRQRERGTRARAVRIDDGRGLRRGAGGRCGGGGKPGAVARVLGPARAHIPLAQADEGLNIKHDVAVPISSIARFIDETDAAIQQVAPGARMVTFGHLGDGNLHYNVQTPEGGDPKAFLAEFQKPINRVVYDNVHRHHGTISAEHGIGQLKIDDAQRYKSPVEIELMKTLKRALDPHQLLNPGKVLR